MTEWVAPSTNSVGSPVAQCHHGRSCGRRQLHRERTRGATPCWEASRQRMPAAARQPRHLPPNCGWDASTAAATDRPDRSASAWTGHSRHSSSGTEGIRRDASPPSHRGCCAAQAASASRRWSGGGVVAAWSPGIWELIVMAGAGLAGAGIAAVIPMGVAGPDTRRDSVVASGRGLPTIPHDGRHRPGRRRGPTRASAPAHRVAVALGVHDHWSRAVTTSTSAQAADAAPSSPGFVQAPSRAATLASTVPSVVGTGSHDGWSRTDHSSSDSFGRGGGGPGGGSW